MTFPLFRRPGTVVVVDDNEDFLEQLKLLLPVHWNVQLQINPHAVIEHVTANAKLCEEDASRQQQLIVESVRDGVSLIDAILKYWANTPERYAITNTVVTDYFMPAMNGLEMLRRLDGWQGARVLLTGQADEQVAVHAFNLGLIDQYISKSLEHLAKRVIDAIRDLSVHAHPRFEHIWRTLLTDVQAAAIQDPAVAKGLHEFVDGRWVEYMVMGRPFGILGLSSTGVPGWLQLESPETLAEAAEIALDAGVDGPSVEEVHAGGKLHAFGIGGPAQRKLVSTALRFGDKHPLLGALFEPWPALPDGGYAQWRARQPGRTIL
ncbi:MAG: response regulator [Ramlibacter sp.]|jgi:CheY-like chemotaxis protein|nr:response regulator [Ramlibacter sp.]